ncbi:uncharacterized protein METZ01_LOCUS322249 [marine metagenome]|uniref:DNA-binding protein HU n=1 Tax=marine metagenome TaxID=408172 RepID=A0A382P9Y1_9ZZZZ
MPTAVNSHYIVRMNKADLIDAISSQSGNSKADAAKSLEAALDAISKSLSEGNSVSLLGFGKFSVARRNARTGRNPQTGAEIQIPARNAVKFSVAKALKDLVQNDSEDTGETEAASQDTGETEAPTEDSGSWWKR